MPGAFHSFHRPGAFYFSVVLHLLLTIAGFAPAVMTFLNEGRWWVNPITRPPAWAGNNTSTMQLHSTVTATWLAVSLFQFVVSPWLMSRASSGSVVSPKRARWMHRMSGYFSVCLLVLFVVNAVHLSLVNGVAGKVVNNFIAIAAGGMMLWHLFWAVRAVRAGDMAGHINQMAGLLCWVCFPGIVRAVAILPFQVVLFAGTGCDSTSTSGLMAFTMPVCASGLCFTRWAALGPKRAKTAWGDFSLFYLVMLADTCLGLLDGSLFACSDNPWLEQVAGQPWKLVSSLPEMAMRGTWGSEL